MKSETSLVNETLMDARRALQRNDRQDAKRLAELVASRAPELEEPWLILASLASPQESVAYLKKALIVNPQSKMARKGMHWAITRLRNQKPQAKGGILQKAVKPIDGTTAPVQPQETPRTRTFIADPSKSEVIRQAEMRPDVQTPSSALASRRLAVLPALLLAACVLAGVWAIWPGNVLPVQAFLRENISHSQALDTPSLPAAPGGVLKPTYTPTSTPTSTPTPTYTPTPTATNTPLPTFTPLPTNTPFPTTTPIPQPTYQPPGSGGERWIDVNLSEQRVYAYEGNAVVNSFLVSTGTWAHPTVTGQYNIYIKLRYTDMAGPGYYLPDVPYTMYFYSGYALHGTYWHHNFGVPMSHGCINLYTPDAAWLFDWASVGTLVNIHY